MRSAAMEGRELELATMRTVSRRLIPYLFVLFRPHSGAVPSHCGCSASGCGRTWRDRCCSDSGARPDRTVHRSDGCVQRDSCVLVVAPHE